MHASRWEVEDFISKGFCNKIIKMAESNGFEQELSAAKGAVFKKYRNNDRVTFNDSTLARQLWEKMKDDPHLKNPGWQPIGLNERFRVYRYSGPEQYFASHFDGSYERIPFVERSYVTLLIYLNEDFDGGETSFIDGETKPKTGLASLMTQGNYLHESREVTNGTKYVLRTDVMYRRTKSE
tara:strand:+ start:819 stop:1361 length:543 start_codon:yes stop_codon:yes gene_type:complete